MSNTRITKNADTLPLASEIGTSSNPRLGSTGKAIMFLFAKLLSLETIPQSKEFQKAAAYEAVTTHLEKEITQSIKVLPELLAASEANIKTLETIKNNSYATQSHKDMITPFMATKNAAQSIIKQEDELQRMILALNGETKLEIYEKMSALFSHASAGEKAEILNLLSTLKKSIDEIVKIEKSTEINKRPIINEVQEVYRKTISVLSSVAPSQKPAEPAPGIIPTIK